MKKFYLLILISYLSLGITSCASSSENNELEDDPLADKDHRLTIQQDSARIRKEQEQRKDMELLNELTERRKLKEMTQRYNSQTPKHFSSSGFSSNTSSGFSSKPSSGFSSKPSSGFSSNYSSGSSSNYSSGYPSNSSSGFPSKLSPGFASKPSPGFSSNSSSGFPSKPASGFSSNSSPSSSPTKPSWKPSPQAETREYRYYKSYESPSYEEREKFIQISSQKSSSGIYRKIASLYKEIIIFIVVLNVAVLAAALIAIFKYNK